MSIEKNNGKRPVIFLGVLQIFIAISSVPPGIAMIIDPSGTKLGMPIEMLINSNIIDFLVPGIFLLVVNGIGSLFGGVATLLQYRFSGEITVGLSTFLILWTVDQAWWMSVHWFHFMYILFGILELVLGLMLRKKISYSINLSPGIVQ